MYQLYMDLLTLGPESMIKMNASHHAHPEVESVHFATIFAPLLIITSLFGETPNAILAILVYLMVLAVWWDGQFWNILLSVPMYFANPFIAIFLA